MSGWAGRWVADRLHVTVGTSTASAGVPVEALVGLALRRNPRRAHLLVSTVLGKHVPTDPRLIHATGGMLGRLVADALADRAPLLPPELQSMFRAALAGAPAEELARAVWRSSVASDAVVLGYAETATALSHSVADTLRDACYLHTTRRRASGLASAFTFEEEHSHATSHVVLPRDPAVLHDGKPLVLVDDELSTGQTVLNTISALHRVAPRRRYVVAALVDLRTRADRARFDALGQSLGARVDVVSLAEGTVDLPTDLARRTAEVLAEVDAMARPAPSGPVGSVTALTDFEWPAALPTGGRHGFTPAHRDELATVLPMLSKAVATDFAPGDRVLVLGFEELMYLPMRLAETIAGEHPEVTVRSSATTRSPVLAVPDEGYPIQHALVFPAHDGSDDAPRYVYNVRPPGSQPWDVIVAVVDTEGATGAWRSGLVEALRPHSRRVLTVTVPA